MKRCDGWHPYNWWRPRCCGYHLGQSLLDLVRPWHWGGPANGHPEIEDAIRQIRDFGR